MKRACKRKLLYGGNEERRNILRRMNQMPWKKNLEFFEFHLDRLYFVRISPFQFVNLKCFDRQKFNLGILSTGWRKFTQSYICWLNRQILEEINSIFQFTFQIFFKFRIVVLCFHWNDNRIICNGFIHFWNRISSQSNTQTFLVPRSTPHHLYRNISF